MQEICVNMQSIYFENNVDMRDKYNDMTLFNIQQLQLNINMLHVGC